MSLGLSGVGMSLRLSPEATGSAKRGSADPPPPSLGTEGARPEAPCSTGPAWPGHPTSGVRHVLGSSGPSCNSRLLL